MAKSHIDQKSIQMVQNVPSIAPIVISKTMDEDWENSNKRASMKLRNLIPIKIAD